MLDKIEIFQDLNTKELEHIAQITSQVNFNRGEEIFRERDTSRDFYVIRSGQVEISIRDLFGDKKVISMLRNGDFFGEMALFDGNSARSATAIAIQKTSVYKIESKEFERLLKEYPNISFKLLGALSRRLREASQARVIPVPIEECREGRILTVASARNGYGKTTLSTTIAHLLSREAPRKVLYVDMDLYYGDGTYIMGLFSPKSIWTIQQAVLAGIRNLDELSKYIVRINENLYSIPAPKDFLDAEKVTIEGFIQAIRLCRSYFDYIVIDTSSAVTDLFLNILDLSDHIYCLLEMRDSLSIKSNALFFNAIDRLRLPEDHIHLIGSKVEGAFDPERTRRLFKYPVIGWLPLVKDIVVDHGKPLYETQPTGSYCEAVRGFLSATLSENAMKKPGERGFLYNLFFSGNETEKKEPSPANGKEIRLESGSPDVGSDSYSSLIKFLKLNLSYGYLDQAKRDAFKIAELCPKLATPYQVLGEIFYQEKDFSMAIDAFKKALSLEPENLTVQAFLAVIEGNEERKKALIERIDAETTKASFPDSLNEVGRLNSIIGRSAEAEALFNLALEKNPKYSEARLNLAVTLGDMRRYDDAIHHLLGVEPKNVRVFYLLGKFFYATGRLFYAMRSFERVTEHVANYFDVREKLEQLRAYFGKLESLLEMHRGIAKTHPSYPDLYYKIGNMEVLMGDREKAAASFREALRINPEFEDARRKLEGLDAQNPVNLEFTNQVEAALFHELKKEQEFTVEIAFEKTDGETGWMLEKGSFVLQVRNLRNGKEVPASIFPGALKSGKLEVSVSGIAPTYPGDLLLFQLTDDGTHIPVASLPHFVTEDEVKNLRITKRIDRSTCFHWHTPLPQDLPFQLPVKSFFVSVHCPSLAKAITGERPDYRVEMVNFMTQGKAFGKADRDDPGVVNFLLQSADGLDVVRKNDQLNLQVFDRDGYQVLNMEFPVLFEDVENFRKSIALDVMGFYFPGKTGNPQPRVPKEKAAETGSGASNSSARGSTGVADEASSETPTGSSSQSSVGSST